MKEIQRGSRRASRRRTGLAGEGAGGEEQRSGGTRRKRDGRGRGGLVSRIGGGAGVGIFNRPDAHVTAAAPFDGGLLRRAAAGIAAARRMSVAGHAAGIFDRPLGDEPRNRQGEGKEKTNRDANHA